MKNKMSYVAMIVTFIFNGMAFGAEGTPQPKNTAVGAKQAAPKAETFTEKAERKKKEAAQKRIDAVEQDKLGFPKKATQLRVAANKLEAEVAQLERSAKENPGAPAQ